MTNLLSPLLKQKFFDNNGKPAAGYKLFSYEAGTTTKLDTYPDEDTSGVNPNPIVLDFRGEANVWVPPNTAYKFVFAPPNDTDPPTAPIWTVDDVIDSQLITLYGGVDTGSTNAYVLNFVANFEAYADGIVIYWIPANTNTGASTINVNGLGPVAILNQDGTALTAGQVVANQVSTIMYKGTGFRLVGATATTTSLWGGTSTGVANTYTLAATQVAAYYEGLIIYWIPNASNTGATTINVNGLGAKSIKMQSGLDLLANQLISGSVSSILYTGGQFVLISSGTFVPSQRSAANSGGATVTSSQTGLVDLNLGSVYVGQLFLVTGYATMTKGGTPGLSRLDLSRPAGTATIDFTGQGVAVPQIDFFAIPAGNSLNCQIVAIGRVTVAGTYTLRLNGTSLGSDSSVASGGASLVVVALG